MNISSMAKKIYFIMLKNIYRIFVNIPKNSKLIVFESFLGKQYSDSPRAIYEYIKENHPALKTYWVVDPRYKNNFADCNLRTVYKFSPKWLLIMLRSKYWVFNTRIPLWVKRGKGTVYLQTWHGTPLKKLGLDIKEVHMPGTTTESYHKNFSLASKKWTYLISANKFSSEIFKRAFDFDGEMIEVGYPRNDKLIKDNTLEKINSIKNSLSIDRSKKVILYAPTWRDNAFHKKGSYKFQLELDLKHLEKEFGEDYIIIMRLHYLISDSTDFSQYSYIRDCSHYDDISDLYLISDVLITDYSSVFFDYALLKRPILFFAYDLEEYRDKLRGFYLDFPEKAPGSVVKSTEQLVVELRKLEKMNFQVSHKHLNFLEEIGTFDDGASTMNVVNIMLDTN
ncbi:CDP-glycerol glycerophosphotransferase [Streptohalobacillus salinus]|uniref:CDP-glycerol glycerophosphotransferase n=1 Tax=Streptohalobacillus salinus TaxID=621096 RepID=A0A2V3WFM0_9BACI|nr:CDP-glycerol glycerophosphotransferase family protein [Streptohalobacillus salinus]PXW92030.1 CDP-glycerol glycerophosphotransferase [Streptohalobacillus salinus]